MTDDAIPDALRNYFSPYAPMRCAVCDSARSTAIDVAIDTLADEVHKLGYVMAGIEDLLGGKVPSTAEVRTERVRIESKVRRPHRQAIPLGEARAKVVP